MLVLDAGRWRWSTGPLADRRWSCSKLDLKSTSVKHSMSVWWTWSWKWCSSRQAPFQAPIYRVGRGKRHTGATLELRSLTAPAPAPATATAPLHCNSSRPYKAQQRTHAGTQTKQKTIRNRQLCDDVTLIGTLLACFSNGLLMNFESAQFSPVQRGAEIAVSNVHFGTQE